jgi:hypothetical protein
MRETNSVTLVQRERERMPYRSSLACGETKSRNHLRPSLLPRYCHFWSPQSSVIWGKRFVLPHSVHHHSGMTEPEINTSFELLVVDALPQWAWPKTERRGP